MYADAAIDNAPHWTVAETVGLKSREWRAAYVYSRTGLPQKPLTHNVRMQREHEQTDPPYRIPTTQKAITSFAQYALRVGSRTGAVNQPIGNRLLIVHIGRQPPAP